VQIEERTVFNQPNLLLRTRSTTVEEVPHHADKQIACNLLDHENSPEKNLQKPSSYKISSL